MQFTKKAKVAAALGAGAIAVAGSGVAFAYWTSSGSGNGSATATVSHTVTLTGITVSNLAPGLTKSVPYTFTNTAGNGNQNFGVATVSVGTITPAASHTCSASDFNLTPAAAGSVVGTVADGATFTPTVAQEPTITMTDNNANQDGCQGASVALTVSIAQGT